VSRLLLQVCTVLLALIPIATGVVTMLGVKYHLYRPLGLPEAPVLDSNLRFLGGVWLGIGLAMLWLVPSIERQGHSLELCGWRCSLAGWAEYSRGC
jgi:hypothetical protein